MADKESQARALDALFMYDLGDAEHGMLWPILDAVAHDPELALQIRDNYINIYHRCCNVIKIERSGVRTGIKAKQNDNRPFYYGEMHAGYKYSFAKNEIKTRADACAVAASLAARKRAIEDWDGKNIPEKKFQQEMYHANNDGDFVIVDMEYALPGANAQNIESKSSQPRIDMVGLQHIGNGVYRPVLVENKWGMGALGNRCGLADHTDDYCGFIAAQQEWYSYLGQLETQAMQMARLGLVRLPEFFHLDFMARPTVLFALGNIDAVPDEMLQALCARVRSKAAWKKINVGIKYFNTDARRYDGTFDVTVSGQAAA